MVITSATLSLAETYRFRDPKRARELLRPALEVASDRHLASFLQRALGFLAIDSGNYLDAESLFQKSLVAARELGSGRSQSRSHEGLATLAWARATWSRQPPKQSMRCGSAATPATRITGGDARPCWQTP